MTPLAGPRLVTVEELRRAWVAVQAGDFRADSRAPRPRPTGADSTAAPVWTPSAGERALPLIGCAGSVGATTWAVALATAHRGSARVVECCTATATGLAAASTAELGLTRDGWQQGSRDHVLLHRAAGPRPGLADVPTPALADGSVLSIVDAAQALEVLLAGSSWLARLVQTAPVRMLAARATIPGLRRLESCLHLLEGGRTLACVLGPPRRRWPRDVAHSVGPLTDALIHAGRLIEVPEDRTLAVHGLTPAPLPESLVAAATTALLLTKGPIP